MRAVLCRALGPPEALAVEEVPSPKPGPKQVVVSVRAAGVNFPDTLVIQGKYQLKPQLPFSPGGEMAGVVKEVGEAVTHLRAGDPVIAFAGWGAFAEEALVEASNAMAAPAGLDPRVAASFAMAYGTSLHALQDRAGLAPGETLLVLGAAGGVGLAAVELGKLLGARVIAAASTDAKLEVCRRRGADELVSYGSEGWRDRVKELTGGKGVDVVYDPVGGALAEPALRLLAWGGRHLVVGFAGGDIPRIPLNLPLLKGFSIVGVYWGEFARREPQRHQANMRRLLGLLSEGKLEPLVSKVYPLERAGEALRALMDRQATGKLVLVP
ncbi:MAG TPA: NADPH:quinone oxidoreductase family protein [Anaeromyxobacteraceae bacterium]|nr:NADPH:quinone oxidoreductase family protein [Anaeromyxobacteraceae bacterium]